MKVYHCNLQLLLHLLIIIAPVGTFELYCVSGGVSGLKIKKHCILKKLAVLHYFNIVIII
jgi:hypothetical protein